MSDIDREHVIRVVLGLLAWSALMVGLASVVDDCERRSVEPALSEPAGP